MIIERLNETHAILYRTLRLQSLKENPEAFGSSFEEESKMELEFFKKRLSDPDNVTFGVFNNHNLIGILTLRTSQRIKTKHNGHLVAMYVDKDHRRKGIGKLLIKKVISYAKNHGIMNLFLTVTSSNKEAIKLYEHMGFEIYGIEKREIYHNHQYLDSYLMAYYL